jgi:hypothetical protein
MSIGNLPSSFPTTLSYEHRWTRTCITTILRRVRDVVILWLDDRKVLHPHLRFHVIIMIANAHGIGLRDKGPPLA